MDLELMAPMEPQAALAALQNQLPCEFQLLTAQQVALEGPGLSALVRGALWHFEAAMVDGLPTPSPIQWQEALKALGSDVTTRVRALVADAVAAAKAACAAAAASRDGSAWPP